MFFYCLRVYSCMGYKPAASKAATTGGYSHVLSTTRFSVIPAICLAAQWQNPSSIFNIAPITTQIFLPYRITACDTSFYIIYWDHIISPVFVNTFEVISHHLCVFLKFWNTARQLLVLYKNCPPNIVEVL